MQCPTNFTRQLVGLTFPEFWRQFQNENPRFLAGQRELPATIARLRDQVIRTQTSIYYSTTAFGIEVA